MDKSQIFPVNKNITVLPRGYSAETNYYFGTEIQTLIKNKMEVYTPVYSIGNEHPNSLFNFVNDPKNYPTKFKEVGCLNYCYIDSDIKSLVGNFSFYEVPYRNVHILFLADVSNDGFTFPKNSVIPTKETYDEPIVFYVFDRDASF